jgi:hypothetical protein
LKDTEDILDELVDEFVTGSDAYIAKLRKILSHPTISADDIKQMADISFELSQFADEMAGELEYQVEERNQRRF